MPAFSTSGFVDPIARTLEIYRCDADGWIVTTTHGGATRVRPEPFEAIEIDLARWWGEDA